MNPSFYKYFIGCQCHYEDGKSQPFTACMYDQMMEGLRQAPTLELTSLRNITREHSIEVCKLLFPSQSKGAGADHLAATGKRVILDYFFGTSMRSSVSASLKDTLTKLFPLLIDNHYDVFLLNAGK